MNTSTAPKGPTMLELAFVGASLLYFVFKAFYFAFTIGPNVFPDEITWFGISEVFSRSLLPPNDSPDSYQYGPITHMPMLYFFLMGKCLNMNFLPLSDLVFLRCVNALLGVITVWYGWKTIRLLTPSLPARLLFVVFMTNTLMFTFLFASVSYDNLTNLFSALIIYHLVAFFIQRRPRDLLLTFIYLCLGGLTKLTFLPVAFLALIVLVLHEWRRLKLLPAAVRDIFSRPFSGPAILSCVFLLLLAANGNLYLGNVLRFGKLQPNADQVLTLEQALQYRIFARNYILGQYKHKKISFQEAVKMTSVIKHEGDRQGTIYLLQNLFIEKNTPSPDRMDRFRYIFSWTDLMFSKIFGIMGHLSMEKPGPALIPYYIIILAGFFFMVRGLTIASLEGTGWLLLFMFLGYTAILMQVVNFRNYEQSGVIVFALQGRYLFPVIVPLYALVASFLMMGMKLRSLQWAACVAAAAVFIHGEFPWFMKRVTDSWFFN